MLEAAFNKLLKVKNEKSAIVLSELLIMQFNFGDISHPWHNCVSKVSHDDRKQERPEYFPMQGGAADQHVLRYYLQ